MKIYISGKITGDSGYIEKFKAAEKEIRQQYKGCEVINPAVILQTMPESTTHEEYMMISLCLLDMCDSIYLLPDWKESKGAKFEYCWANNRGYKMLGCFL